MQQASFADLAYTHKKRSAYRHRSDTGDRYNSDGFRLARTITS